MMVVKSEIMCLGNPEKQTEREEKNWEIEHKNKKVRERKSSPTHEKHSLMG